MKVTIDPYSGFCFGVKNAIEIAEKELLANKQINLLGNIVHNNEEITRLKRLGASTIDYDQLSNSKKKSVLFRAHGEAPSVYQLSNSNEHRIVDATCPIVIKLQQKIKSAYKDSLTQNGQIVIFGQRKHPEVVGLNGQTNNTAIIVEGSTDLSEINFSQPIYLFAQTTKKTEEYREIVEIIKKKLKEYNQDNHNFNYYNTICGQVSNRVPKLKKFCTENELIIFVSGKKSSNGQFLYSICKETNPNSFFISSSDELQKGWFKSVNKIGISGATSTPFWLLEEVAKTIENY